jgi:hypothetical protein
MHMVFLKISLHIYGSQQFLAADSSSITHSVRRSVRPSVRPSVGPSKNVKKVDSGPKNGPILMGDGSLEVYGLVVSFF